MSTNPLINAPATGTPIPEAAPNSPQSTSMSLANTGIRVMRAAFDFSGSLLSAAASPIIMNVKTVGAVMGALISSQIPVPAVLSKVASSALGMVAEQVLSPITYLPTVVTSLSGFILSSGIASLIGVTLSPVNFVPSAARAVVSAIPAQILIGGALGYMAAKKLVG